MPFFQTLRFMDAYGLSSILSAANVANNGWGSPYKCRLWTTSSVKRKAIDFRKSFKTQAVCAVGKNPTDKVEDGDAGCLCFITHFNNVPEKYGFSCEFLAENSHLLLYLVLNWLILRAFKRAL